MQNLLSFSFLPKNIKIKMYRSIIFPFVFYGSETLSFTQIEECRLRVFGNRVMKRIFGCKRDEVTGERRKLPSKELDDLYCSPNIQVIKSRRIRWVGHIAHMGERRSVYRVLVGKPEGKRPLGRPRHRWEDIIKMNLNSARCYTNHILIHSTSV